MQEGTDGRFQQTAIVRKYWNGRRFRFVFQKRATQALGGYPSVVLLSSPMALTLLKHTMKAYPFFAFTLLLLLVAGCSLFNNDEESPLCAFVDTYRFSKDTSLVVGTWDWAYSNQNSFRGPCIRHSPRTEGYSMSRVFTTDGEMRRSQAGEVVEEGRYYFEESGLDETGVSIYIGSPLRFGVSADTLILDGSPVDGPQEVYVRRR